MNLGDFQLAGYCTLIYCFGFGKPSLASIRVTQKAIREPNVWIEAQRIGKVLHCPVIMPQVVVVGTQIRLWSIVPRISSRPFFVDLICLVGFVRSDAVV